MFYQTLMRLFGNKESFCTICNKSITHKNKAKREWGVKSPLCSDCYIDKMKESYDAAVIRKCIDCGMKSKVTDLWESSFNKEKNFCCICGNKLGFVRYNPKNKWEIKGFLCKNCWDDQKSQNG